MTVYLFEYSVCQKLHTRILRESTFIIWHQNITKPIFFVALAVLLRPRELNWTLENREEDPGSLSPDVEFLSIRTFWYVNFFEPDF
jgi:hypothetical protein